MGINSDKVSDRDVVSLIESNLHTECSDNLFFCIGAMKHLGGKECEAYFSMLKIISEHITNEKTVFFGTESIGKLVKNYVKNNLSDKLTLKDIARNLHCSTVTLTEHFKGEFGITIVEYITKKRMQQSELLLVTTDTPLREVAALCG